jgi:hypothetical protein
MATTLKTLFDIVGSDIYGSIMVLQKHHVVMLYVHSLFFCKVGLNLKSWTGSVTYILKKGNKNRGAVDSLKCIVALL